ncbi:lymphocyte antigen 6L [Marmota flaviventris]|uniref:lymphocyte antigen 6L n=1 Tax=Marmota flaviventris TaxID=93162 RepID=UPI003A88AB0A
MGRLVLVLWAALVSTELARADVWPSKGRGARSAHSSALERTTQNLSCFQCFKVNSWSLCKPTVCPATAQVCVSNEVFLLRSESVQLPRLGPHPPPTRSRIRILISKRCAVRCPNSNSEFEWSSSPELRGRIVRRCCSGQLCNSAPAVLEIPWALFRWLLLQVALAWVSSGPCCEDLPCTPS